MGVETFWDHHIAEGSMRHTPPSLIWRVGGWTVAYALTGGLLYVVFTWAIPTLNAAMGQLMNF